MAAVAHVEPSFVPISGHLDQYFLLGIGQVPRPVTAVGGETPCPAVWYGIDDLSKDGCRRVKEGGRAGDAGDIHDACSADIVVLPDQTA